jgi:ComF family protein
MSMLETLRRVGCRWARHGLDLLYPPRCVFCRRELGDEHAPASGLRGANVCEPCGRALVADQPRCPTCGAPGASAGCGRCRGRSLDWDGIAVLGPYADELRAAVLRAKRPSGDVVSTALADLLVRRHRDLLATWRIDVVVPVPMHWLRRSLRGTSAAEELARGVAAGLGLPCRPWLRRARATPMQNELPVEARRGNVREAFRASRRLEGRRVLLVDDVATTGATLGACRGAARAVGAAAVYAAVAARAERLDSPAAD